MYAGSGRGPVSQYSAMRQILSLLFILFFLSGVEDAVISCSRTHGICNASPLLFGGLCQHDPGALRSVNKSRVADGQWGHVAMLGGIILANSGQSHHLQGTPITSLAQKRPSQPFILVSLSAMNPGEPVSIHFIPTSCVMSQGSVYRCLCTQTL